MATAHDAIGADLIASALESRRQKLVSAGLNAIRSRMRAYMEADPAHLEHVREHIAEHHDLVCVILRRGRPADPRKFEFVSSDAAIRGRRGIVLHDFLEAFRRHHNIVWDASRPAATAACRTSSTC